VCRAVICVCFVACVCLFVQVCMHVHSVLCSVLCSVDNVSTSKDMPRAAL
jgi:hypothetical protein